MMSHRVLIADDDLEMTNVLAHRCRQMGIAVETASSSMEALRKLELRPPDAAILDVNMPEGNGLAVCEMIAHHAELKNLPVIILTGKKDPNTIQRCHELSAFYVSKCDDVWPRIGPLLQEVLELPEPGTSVETPAVIESTIRVDAPRAYSPPDIMDAVFAALACDENYLGAVSAAHGAKAAPRPWVLCIDDDATFSFGLQMRLQGQGVDVLRAFGGREGYRCAFHSRAQAIILDYELPQGNGDYVLRRLKENPVTRDIPVIVLTGNRDRQVQRNMFSLGAACFMNKPYDWSELWSELQRHLVFGEAAHRETVEHDPLEHAPSLDRITGELPVELLALGAQAS